MRGERDTAIDIAVAQRAGLQHGVVARRQLLATGLSARSIDGWLEKGRLHPLHRGVYAVGHTKLTAKARWMAAVLACGDGAALSHVDAGALWDLRASGAGRIHVTVPSSAGRVSRPGIALHRCRTLDADDVTDLDGISVTRVALTLLDLAGMLAAGPLQRIVERAVFLRLLDANEFNATLARHPNRRNAATLKAIVANVHHEPQLTRSELEGFFVDLCDANAIPRPEVNQTVAGFEVDFLWRRYRLIVEADGRRAHLTPTAFERDRARDARLTLAGFRVVRFTYRQIAREPEHVARTVLRLLEGGLPQ